LLEANVGKPLLDVLRDLMLDPDEQAAFADDPSRYLAQYGYEDVEADHLNEAFSLVADTLPPDVAQTVTAAAPVASATQTADPTELGDTGPGDTGGDIDPDAFGGVNAGFDTMALNGTAGAAVDHLDDADADDEGSDDVDEGSDDTFDDGLDDAGPGPTDGADDVGGDGDGGFGSGELALGDLADDDGLDAGDAVAFGVGSDSAEPADDAAAVSGLTDLGDGATTLVPDDNPSVELDDLAGGDAGDEGFDDAPDYDEGGLGLDTGDDDAPLDDVDDGPADDPSFDDIGSF
jgi:hypothetical protein